MSTGRRHMFGLPLCVPVLEPSLFQVCVNSCARTPSGRLRQCAQCVGKTDSGDVPRAYPCASATGLR
eukprot:2941687-Alexandrium_andersonii.AAC.1